MATAESAKAALTGKSLASVPSAPDLPIIALIDRMRPEMARVLPRHITADRIARIATTSLRQTPRLRECTSESFLGALMQCATLGLEPGPLGHAYLVPFKNKGVDEVTFIPGYKGLIALAHRTPGVQVIARAAYEGDEFTVEFGTSDRIIHKPTMGDRGKPIAYYAVAKFNGGYNFVVLSPSDILMAKASSKTPTFGPWVDHFLPMALKTCIKRLAPYMPASIDFARALEADGGVTNGIDFDVIDAEPDVIEGQTGAHVPEDIDPETGEILPPEVKA